MRTLAVGSTVTACCHRALVVILAMAAAVSAAAAADRPALTSEDIFDPSINVVAPQPAGPHAAVGPFSGTGLVITPVFDASITKDPSGATIMNTINAAIMAYETQITDPITVVIKFKKMSGGLGRSSTYYTSVTYSSYHTALTSHATSADDATALANLPGLPNNPVNGNANMFVKLPNLRALGFSADPPTGQTDGTISLHTSICNLDRVTIDPMKYDLLSVVSHEIDEVLGLSSALSGPNGAPAPSGPVFPQDLYRYDGVGARSFNNTLASQAFFSIDGSTQLARYNQTAGGDFGDWFSDGPHTPQVQDAFATPGATPNLGVELTALDVIGYTLGAATPPSQDDDTGFVPPDPNSETCEVAVAKNVRTLEGCIETCHITAANKAFNGKTYIEENCETSCRSRYTSKQNKLVTGGTCPACLGATQQTSLADQAETDLDAGNSALYCSGAIPFGDDDTGFVPPDPGTLACEAGVAKNVKKLRSCIEKCHFTAAIKAFLGKPFDEEGCEHNDPAKSCRAKYNVKQGKLLTAGGCPACLDAAAQASLANQVETDLDAANGTVFCAGTTPFPPPW